MFWERGSLVATAITPIVVALVSEALNRPAKVITGVEQEGHRAAARPVPRCGPSSPPASARAAKAPSG